MPNNKAKRKIILYPPSPAPSVIPTGCSWNKNENPDMILKYVFLYIYVWTDSENSFWMYPIGIWYNNIYGYIWDNSKWKYEKIHINSIDRIF